MKVKETEFKIIYGNIENFLHKESFVPSPLKGKVSEGSLRKAFRDVFHTAQKLKHTKVIFCPAAGDPPFGDAGFPPVGLAKIVAQEVLRFCRAYPGVLKNMVLVIKDRETFHLFEKEVYGYLRHVQEDLGCGPYVTVDMIIELKKGLVLIERTNPPFGFALPGGFVDHGESLEDAARREAKEETNLDLVNLEEFRTYSDPKRDPRFHTVSTVFIGKGKGTPKFGDDAKGLKVVPYEDLLKYDYAFDHKQIIKDYLIFRKKGDRI